MVASTTPIEGYGVVVTWAGHDIGYLQDVAYSGIEAGTFETSSHESRYKTYLGGMIDGGELTLPVRFIPGDTTGQKYLLADVKTRTERQVVITASDGSTWTFNAVATKFGDFTYPMEGAVDANLVVKVSGEPVFSEEA